MCETYLPQFKKIICSPFSGKVYLFKKSFKKIKQFILLSYISNYLSYFTEMKPLWQAEYFLMKLKW